MSGLTAIICGGRTFGDTYTIDIFKFPDIYAQRTMQKCFQIAWLNDFHKKRPISVVGEGEANGADNTAKIWTQAQGLILRPFPAPWKEHGKRAGSIRNQQMLDEVKPDVVIGFPGGTGTAHMLDIAKKAGVETIKVKMPFLLS